MSTDQLPGSKRGQKPDLSDCKSLDPTKSCEICGESMKCLCHVEIEDLQTKETYYWKAGSDENDDEIEYKTLTKEGTDLVVLQPSEKSGKDQMIFEPYKLKFKIKNSDCKEGNPNYCSQLFFYETKELEGSGGNDYHQKINNIIDIAESKGKNGDLELEFNTEYFTSDKVPAYASVEIDEEGEKSYQFKPSGGKVIREPIGKKGEYVSLDFLGSETLVSGDENIPFFLNMFDRTWGVMFSSKISSMPVTSYYLAVPECEGSDLSILESQPKAINVYVQDSKALAKVHLLPGYECTYEIEVGFDKAIKLANLKSFEKVMDQFEFNVHINEKFQGEYENEVNFKLVDFIEFLKDRFKDKMMIGLILQIAADVKAYLKYFYEMNTAIEHTFTSLREQMEGNTMGRAPARRVARTEIAREKAITLSGILPHVKISGTASVTPDGKDILIKRNEVKLDFNPLFGAKIELDLAILAIRKVPQLNALYESARGVCSLVNSGQFGAHLLVSTKRDALKDLPDVEKDRHETVFISGSLILYFTFSIELHKSPTLKFIDSKVDEDPEREGESSDGSEVAVEDYNEFILKLEGGVSFEARVWVVTGGFELGFEFETGLVWGAEKVVRKNAKGEDVDLLMDYLFFKGLDFAWTLKIYLGFSVRNEATKERDQLGGLNIENPKSYGEGYDVSTTDGSSSYPYNSLETAQQRSDDMKANREFPDYTPHEYYELHGGMAGGGHLRFYKDHQADLAEIARINRILKTSVAPNHRKDLLNKRFEIIHKLNQDIKDMNLPLPKDGFMMSSVFEETKLRDEHRKNLNEELDKTGSAEAQKAKKDLDDLDKNGDMGRGTLIDPRFFKGDLKGAEEDDLKERILKKTRRS